MAEKNKILERAAKEINSNPDNLPKVLMKLQNEINEFDEKIRKLR